MKKDNLNKIKKENLFADLFSNLSSLKGELNKLYISSLYGASKAFLIEELIKHENQLVILLPEIKSTEELNVELGILGLEKETILIDDFRAESIQGKLTDVTNRDKYIIISTYDLLNLKLPQKDDVDKKTTKIQAGGNISFDEIIEYLNLLNYQKDKFVEAPGEFSQRGSIIDFWSYSEHNPVRLEFDGDFLESIRHFDPESQRSIEKIDNVTLAATLEQEEDCTNHSDIFDYLQNPLIFASEFELENLNHQPINLFTKDEEAHADVKISDESLDDEFPEPGDQHTDIKQHETVTKTDITTKENTRWILEEELSTSNNRIELGLTEAPSINSNYEALFSVLKDYADKSYDVILTSENELQTNRLKELLSEFKLELAELIETGKLKLETLAIKDGFLHKKEKILLLTDYQVFGKPYRTKLPQKKRFKKSKSKAFASIKRGDYVVHEDYGIGQYSGLETIKIGESNQESMKLLYNEGGVVYVNLNYLNLVKRYSSNENLSPTLSTLGTGEWDRKKTRTKKKIKVAARELIELYAKRKAEKGFGFGTDTVWQKELEVSFLYEDTPDQEKVTEEVKEDMEAENPMDRLVCGDVGFGKTEVAVRAAFKAVQDGKQVALLVPTTILAEQHHNTFKDRLTQFPVNVAALSRFQTQKEQKEIVAELENGTTDVVIGTHRMLSKDVKFKDLGLLMIDEEHRFGVTAKEKLRAIKVNVDTLTLTATPIPRTLNLSLLGARDLSIIATPPTHLHNRFNF